MNLLLDTHTLIWFITDNDKLSSLAKHNIESKQNNCFVSIASFWEIGIKHSLGRLDLNSDLSKIFKIIEATEFDILPITVNQILMNSKLEYHHQDPFDRIIIAQAISENLTIISKDSQFDKYNVPIIW